MDTMAPIVAQRIRHAGIAEPEPGLWSNCKRYGDQVFLSGLVALAGDDVVGGADPFKQACHIFDCMRRYMEAAGGTIDDILKMTIFITDIRNRPMILEARRQFFTGDFPCSTLVAVSALIDPRLLVEIEAVGYVGSSGARPPS
jgi:2-iminobutanoate/2-iminopropanoate deaminase